MVAYPDGGDYAEGGRGGDTVPNARMPRFSLRLSGPHIQFVLSDSC